MQQTTDDSQQRENLRIVQAAYQAVLRGDLTALDAVAHAELAIHAAQSLPYGGIYRGFDAFRQAGAAFAQLWDEPQITVEQFLAGGDCVAMVLRLSARHRASGRPFSTTLVEVWRLRNGKVIEILPFYWDTGAITALGKAGQYAREPTY